MGCWCNHSDEEPEDADYDPQWIKEMYFLTRDPNESVFSWTDSSSETGSSETGSSETGSTAAATLKRAFYGKLDLAKADAMSRTHICRQTASW